MFRCVDVFGVLTMVLVLVLMLVVTSDVHIIHNPVVSCSVSVLVSRVCVCVGVDDVGGAAGVGGAVGGVAVGVGTLVSLVLVVFCLVALSVLLVFLGGVN